MEDRETDAAAPLTEAHRLADDALHARSAPLSATAALAAASLRRPTFMARPSASFTVGRTRYERRSVLLGVPAQMVASRAGFNCLAAPTPTSDSGPVPGQRKRKRRQDAERQRHAARTAPDAGRWELIFETPDEAELRAHLRRLREARIDGSMIRIDTLCGRLVQPTAYRLSRFVADPACESDSEHSDH
ncbi:hypothetical protein OG788_02650 [Streptomyces sp. NBC_00647]|uniref:hypothetical protein n=1 Tax=Streptomyces sp. NBC_00647 TaxID=2975796 RepID=UPI00324FAD88